MRTIQTLMETGMSIRGVPVRIKGTSPLCYVSHEDNGYIILAASEIKGRFHPSDLEVQPDLLDAIYVSVWDDALVLRSACVFDTKLQVVQDIEEAADAHLADECDALTDEYLVLCWTDERGVVQEQKLRERDGIRFAYKQNN